MKSNLYKNIRFIVILNLFIFIYFSFVIFDKKGLLKSINLLIIFIIISLATIINIIIYINSRKLTVEKKFVYIAIFFGILLIIAIPILHGIDEGAHFFKVYSIFNNCESTFDEEKQLVDKIPKTIYIADSINKYADIFNSRSKIDNADTYDSDMYIGAKLYSFISYIPYLLSMFIFQKLLNMNILWIVLLGRCIAFAFWMIISFYTIKIIPYKKEFLAFLCLMPMTLTLVTTYTGDLVTNSSILLFVAIWYRLLIEKREIKKSEIILITILGITSVCSKIVYALLFFLIFLLPKENFKNKKQKLVITSCIIMVLVIASFINLQLVGNELISAYPAIQLQKEFILNNFFRYICIFFKTIVSNFSMYLYQFTTGQTTICHNSISVDSLISIAYWIILISALFLDTVKIQFSRKQKVFILSIVFLIIFIIFLSLYLQWTATYYGIGSNIIYGVQGRYFIPISTLLILFNTKKYYINENVLWSGVISINLIILIKIIITFL